MGRFPVPGSHDPIHRYPTIPFSGFDFAFPLSSLAPLTAYNFRAVASNSAGLIYGQTLEFTTQLPAPIIASLPATNVSYYSGTLLW